MRSIPWLVAPILMVCLLDVSPAVGQPSPLDNAKSKFGVKFGLVYSSFFRVDSTSNESGTGISGGAYFDVPVSGRVLSGLSLDLHDLHIFEKRKKVLDLALPIKYIIRYERQNWELRPMVAVGFGYHSQVDYLERCTYLTLKGGCEALFHTSSKYSFVFDLLVFGLPTGGNGAHRVNYGPTLLLRAGIVY